MFLKPRSSGSSMRVLCGFRGGNDYLIILRFDKPQHDKAHQDFHAWALDFFEGLYSTLPSQSIVGVFIGTPEELKTEIEKELK
jgi:hypothetical protein